MKLVGKVRDRLKLFLAIINPVMSFPTFLRGLLRTKSRKSQFASQTITSPSESFIASAIQRKAFENQFHIWMTLSKGMKSWVSQTTVGTAKISKFNNRHEWRL